MHADKELGGAPPSSDRDSKHGQHEATTQQAETEALPKFQHDNDKRQTSQSAATLRPYMGKACCCQSQIGTKFQVPHVDRGKSGQPSKHIIDQSYHASRRR